MTETYSYLDGIHLLIFLDYCRQRDILPFLSDHLKFVCRKKLHDEWIIDCLRPETGLA